MDSAIIRYGVQIGATIVATICVLVDGMQCAWISPATPKLLANNSVIPVTKDEARWVSLAYLIGAVTGPPISFFAFSKIGRKWAIVITMIPIGLAWVGIIVAQSAIYLYIARFIGGIGANMLFVSVPAYLGEISEPEVRGALGGIMIAMFNIGIVISFCVTPYVDLRIPGFIALGFLIVEIGLLKFIPKSPYYLLSKKKEEKARKNLQILRRREDVDEELERIKEAVRRQTEATDGCMKLFTIWPNLKALGILIFLRFAQVMSGIQVTLMNVHRIFTESGVKMSVNLAAITFSLVMLSSAICIIAIVDKFNRRTLMVFSCLVTSVMLFTIGAYFYFLADTKINVNSVSWIPVACTFIFVYGFRAGLGTVPVIMLSELLTMNIKVAGASITQFTTALSHFLALGTFFATADSMGMFVPYFIFGSICFISALVCTQLIETKGKTLDEIQQRLTKRIRQSMVVQVEKDLEEAKDVEVAKDEQVAKNVKKQ